MCATGIFKRKAFLSFYYVYFCLAQWASYDPGAFSSLFWLFPWDCSCFNHLENSGVKPWEFGWLTTVLCPAMRCGFLGIVFERRPTRICVCIRIDLLSVYTANQGTKTGFNYVIYCEGQLQLLLPQKCKAREFRCKLFPIRESWKFSLPPLFVYHERTKAMSWIHDKRNKALPKHRSLFSFLAFMSIEYIVDCNCCLE